MRGRFITFEGTEGIGKSTQLALAARYLLERGLDVLTTREPGGTPVAEKLRNLVLQPANGALDPTAELLMIFAARADHVANQIRPALKRGRWVLCDRFTDATEAYQGGGSGLPLAAIHRLAKIAHPRLEPDLTLLLDAPPHVSSTRLAGRGNRPDRFEGEDVAFFERVRAAYLAIAAREPARVAVIDATGDEQAVAARVAGEIDRRLLQGRA